MARSRTPSTGTRINKQSQPALREQVAQLTDAVTRLAQEVGVLREVLDSIRDDFAWALNNDSFRSAPAMAMHVTSVPRDPLANDFGERINRLTANDLPDAPPADETPAKPRGQSELF